MPELPEVETIKTGLSKLLLSRKISHIDRIWARSLDAPENVIEKAVLGAKVTSVRRRAKVLLIDLDSKYTLLIHLKMTGQLVFIESKSRFGGGHPTQSLISELPDRSTRVIFEFEDGSRLYFNDQRKFGWIKLIPTIEVPNIDFMKKLGPEPLLSKFQTSDFKHQINKRKNSTIKAALLDQAVVAGIGNIYADEALWGAKIHPSMRVKNLSNKQVKHLLKSIRDVLATSIKNGGSTDRNYVNAEGKQGSYLKFAAVFRRTGQPCLRCKTSIVKIKEAGRGTHICPKCQKIS